MMIIGLPSAFWNDQGIQRQQNPSWRTCLEEAFHREFLVRGFQRCFHYSASVGYSRGVGLHYRHDQTQLNGLSASSPALGRFFAMNFGRLSTTWCWNGL
jgi:hypothetical protein